MRRTSVALAVGLALAPWAASAETDGYTLDDYQLRTSGDLLDICSMDSSDAQYWEGRAFCLGYFAGGIDLHNALAVGPNFPRLACPTADATRDDVVAAFIEYGRAHPEHLGEKPMDTVFRAVIAKWPCAS